MIGKLAFVSAQPPPASPLDEDPARLIEAMYLRIWATSMRDLPFVNLALSVEAIGFRRWRGANRSSLPAGNPSATPAEPAGDSGNAAGDWVGAVVTPWFLNLFLLPGGGNLWSDRRPGERFHLSFPIGPLEFIADYSPDAELPAYQYCPLFAPPSEFASQAAARAAATAALDAMFKENRITKPAARPATSATAPADSARRAFLRRFARP